MEGKKIKKEEGRREAAGAKWAGGRGAQGGSSFMAAVMQKCKQFATLAENNDTAGRGRCVNRSVLCGWVQLQHRREPGGGDRRGEMRGGPDMKLLP